MYIEPNGEVRLLHAGLPSDYSDTIYFSSATDQYNYFTGLSGTWLYAQSYTRVNNGIFRCSLPMSTTYNVDYMMFRNSAFENKWFYAFVDKINYTNNGLCEVLFTLDVVQTWFMGGQASLGQCFVARETVADDSIGTNIEPESVQLGEYVCESGSTQLLAGSLFTPCIILAGVGSGAPNGKLYNRVYGAATLYAFGVSDTESVNTVIEEVTRLHGDDNGIVGLYMAPIIGLPNHTVPAAGVAVPEGNGLPTTETLSAMTHSTGFNGYIPKNNKLYTYPYNLCRISTGQGNKADYRYEFFSGGTPTFSLASTILTPVTALCTPINYKNYGTTGNGYYPESVALDGYPTCSWANDVYAAWIAQNSVPMANIRQAYEDKADILADTLFKNNNVKAITTATNMIPSLLSGKFGKAASQYTNATADIETSWNNRMAAEQTGRIDLVTAQLNADYSAAMKNNTMSGTIAGGNITMSLGNMYFYASRWHLNDNRLRDIDDYFSMFGYAVNRVKVPDITSRPHWNYVQTIDADIRGNMPSDDRSIIKGLFEKGIRFWKNGSEIGNYSLDNSPS